MKLSTLIEKLQEAQQQHGDIDVLQLHEVKESMDENDYFTDSVEFVFNEKANTIVFI